MLVIFFVLISFAVGGQHKLSFQWKMGLRHKPKKFKHISLDRNVVYTQPKVGIYKGNIKRDSYKIKKYGYEFAFIKMSVITPCDLYH